MPTPQPAIPGRNRSSVIRWFCAVPAVVVLFYAAYVEFGGAEREAAVRARGCRLCHNWDEPLPCLRTWKQGAPLRPLMEQRLLTAHPLLHRGATDELVSYLLHRQMPLLVQLHANAPGKELYNAKCAACHGKNGMGVPGDFPPLRGSEWIKEDPERLMNILSEGLQGPISVKGETWDKTMRAPGISSPDQARQLIDYLRQEFAH